ncbi:thiopurine S-methyltransferase [Alkalimarinus alittae]|uniref:Thiopurine S-methyltransferase n=1 Tax=Alkalimarinus alittae TaxID=2961619 RepID=A0ABY6N0C9_9ALTE|nr:thiopurine S-methyltransferase [Alkalimarinus alittae]UZE95477.1 thiopurine S-methyltransferase [Alkalimarinus alittae]
MDAPFWHEKWDRGEIAFHEGQANCLLVKHFGALTLAQGSRVFVPLCGKTRDIAWLLTQGYEVVGAELSELAVKALFEDLGVAPDISQIGELTHYCSDNIDIFVGDIFLLSAETLKPVDAIYDRAALVALPEAMRQQYASHLIEITSKAPQLVITFEYDQPLLPGPPFSVSTEEVKQHYSATYVASLLESKNVPGGLKRKVAATESVWLLR